MPVFCRDLDAEEGDEILIIPYDKIVSTAMILASFAKWWSVAKWLWV